MYIIYTALYTALVSNNAVDISIKIPASHRYLLDRDVKMLVLLISVPREEQELFQIKWSIIFYLFIGITGSDRTRMENGDEKCELSGPWNGNRLPPPDSSRPVNSESSSIRVSTLLSPSPRSPWIECSFLSEPASIFFLFLSLSSGDPSTASQLSALVKTRLESAQMRRIMGLRKQCVTDSSPQRKWQEWSKWKW